MSVLRVIDEAEVVVVGAGPAGATAAALLAANGLEVLLVDKQGFPRDKACGDGLTRLAVTFLQDRLGLTSLLDGAQAIEGARFIVGQSERSLELYRPESGKAQYGRCIPRATLDGAIADVALAHGARLMKATAKTLAGSRDNPLGVVVESGNLAGVVQSRYVVIADGATSRLRRETHVTASTPIPRAFAVRQYFRVSQDLAPLFDIHVPLEYGPMGLVGYGWVFPAGDRIANIGVGYYRGSELPAPRSIRQVLEAFVADLKTRHAPRLGEIEPISEPKGAPISIGFHALPVRIGNVFLAGDAAGMTDPYTGEGIAYALGGAEIVATEIHSVARRKARALNLHTQIEHAFPRLCQDPGVILRGYQRHLMETETPTGQREDLVPAGKPFLESIRPLVIPADYQPDFSNTSVFELARDLGVCATELNDLNRFALSELRTEFPFAYELIHRNMRSGAGPAAATTLLFSVQSMGGDPGATSAWSAALAIELVSQFPQLVMRLAERSSGDTGRLNNAFAILIADYALSRSWALVASLRPDYARRFSQAARLAISGALKEVTSSHATSDVAPEYLNVVEERSGALFSLAAEFGAEFSGSARESATILSEFGREVGVALHISDCLCACAEDAELTGGKIGDARGQRSLGRPGRAPNQSTIPRAIDAIGGIEQATEECRLRVAKAQAALEQLPSGTPAPLAALADLALRRVQESLRVSVVAISTH